MFKSHRDESRKNYGDDVSEGFRMNDQQLMLGAVLRIADSMEKSVEDRRKVDSELKWYREGYVEKKKEIESLRRKISANEGVKTKLRAQLREKDELILHLRKNIVELQNG